MTDGKRCPWEDRDKHEQRPKVWDSILHSEEYNSNMWLEGNVWEMWEMIP
jgi:hypothetical protein